jgi:hypothetical protein
VTEGNGHVIDPGGQARRALHAAVAEHGPEALSNAVIMDGICQERLGDLPGEAILIGSAARIDVPALLRDLIPKMGNYGAIQSVAATLAETHGLDNAACVWVVREFARALGLISSGGTQPTARIGSAGEPGPGHEGTAAAEGAVAGEGTGDEAPASESAGSRPAASASPAGGAGVAGGAGGQPPRRPSGSRVLSRNTIGVAAAIALVAGYLGVAAVARLSPFPAQTVAATSSAPPSRAASKSPTPDESPDPAPDPTPPSDYQILLTKIPGNIEGTNNCHNIGTSAGATAVSQCTAPGGLAASTIIYYLYPSQAALGTGFGSFLTSVKFRDETGCTTNGGFVNFTVECESTFTSTSPHVTGSVAEYANQNNDPIIVSSDDQQHVMVVLVGTNDGDLLSYWKQLEWVVP